MTRFALDLASPVSDLKEISCSVAGILVVFLSDLGYIFLSVVCKSTKNMPSKSGISSSDKDIRIGDYVKEKAGKKRSGRVESGDKSAGWSVLIKGEKAPVPLTDDEVEKSRNTFSDFGRNLKEVLLNSVAFASIQGIRKSDSFMGQRSVNFMISDALYEFLARGFVEDMIPFVRPDSTTGDDIKAWFSSKDFKNAAKAIPIVILMQLYGKMVHKHALGHNAGKNILDSFIAVAVANVVDRKLLADKEKTYSY